MLVWPRSGPFVDICPHHKAPDFGTVCGDWQCLPGQSPVLEQWGLQVHWHVVVVGRTRALPTQRLATLSNPVPSLKYLGLVGLSLQLKLKHESSPGCLSLCAAFERGLCQKCVMETAEGVLSFRALCLSGVHFFKLRILLVAAAKCT